MNPRLGEQKPCGVSVALAEKLSECVSEPTSHLEKLWWLTPNPNPNTLRGSGDLDLSDPPSTFALRSLSLFSSSPFQGVAPLARIFSATAPYCMIAPAGSYLMEDPITHEKWALFCNGWLNPEALRSAHENSLKRRDDAEVTICLLVILSFFLLAERQRKALIGCIKFPFAESDRISVENALSLQEAFAHRKICRWEE